MNVRSFSFSTTHCDATQKCERQRAINNHFKICTHAEARAIINRYERFWAFHPPEEVDPECDCVYFNVPPAARKTCHEIKFADVKTLIDKAEEKHLVSLAFKAARGSREFRGICFTKTVPLVTERGLYQQRTDFAECIHCGMCVKVCSFGARSIENVTLHVSENKCVGCGVCANRCPIEAVRMERREAEGDEQDSQRV